MFSGTTVVEDTPTTSFGTKEIQAALKAELLVEMHGDQARTILIAEQRNAAKELELEINKCDEIAKELEKDYGFSLPQKIFTNLLDSNLTLDKLKQIVKEHKLTGSSYVYGIPLLTIIVLKHPDWQASGKLSHILRLQGNPNLKAHKAAVDYHEGTVLHALLANNLIKDTNLFLDKLKENTIKLDLTVADNHQRTSLHMAVLLRKPSVIKRCIECLGLDSVKAAINARDKQQRTPLHLAYLLGDQDLVTLLLECDADSTAIEANGHTPESMLNLSIEVVKDALADFRIDPNKYITTRQMTLLECCKWDRLVMLRAQEKNKQAISAVTPTSFMKPI